MLILFAGDSHGNVPYMNHVFNAAKSAEVDLVVQVGDFGFWPNSGFATLMDDKFTKGELPLWVIEGNHDYPVEAAEYTAEPLLEPGLRHIARATIWDVDDTRFGFMGGAVSVDSMMRVPGRSWWPEEVLTEEDVELAIAAGPVDVWITHDAVEMPPGKPLYRFGEYVDTAVALQRNKMRRIFDVLKPRLHIHGHWHYRYTASTEYGRVIGLDFENGNGILLVDTKQQPS